MFLTPRFFFTIAALALLSVAGFYLPWCYMLSGVGLAVLVVLLAADVVWLYGGVNLRATRHCGRRFSHGEDNAVSLRIDNDGRTALRLVVRDELPGQFRFHDAVFPLRLAAGRGATVRYQLRPTARGTYAFGHVLVFARTLIGFAERRCRLGQPAEVKVYPAFAHLERYALTAATADLLASGQQRVRRAGNRTDFDQIRDYVAGDDYRTLNWKASARAAHWVVNTYTDERSQPVWCLIDKGRVMQRTSAHIALIDYAINASLALAYAALRRYDMPGLVTFDAHIDRTVPPSRRPDQLSELLEALYAQQVRYAETDYSALTVHLARTVRRRSLLVLFTDFTTRESLRRQLPYLRRLASRHCLLVVFFDDEEVARLAEDRDDAFASLGRLRVQALAEDFELSKQNLVAELRQSGINALLTTPRNLTTDTLNKYIELKRRQAI